MSSGYQGFILDFFLWGVEAQKRAYSPVTCRDECGNFLSQKKSNWGMRLILITCTFNHHTIFFFGGGGGGKLLLCSPSP